MATPHTAVALDPGDADLLTIDQLALATGMTVRTTRYYASLGLLPAPLRRGRMAYYGPEHLARLELIRALQDHGFTLAAIERYLAGVPMDASAQELAVQRALLTAWKPGDWVPLTRAELEARAGHALSEDDIDWLLRSLCLRRTGDDFEGLPMLDTALELHDLGMPLQAIVDANAAVRRHMRQLADELTEILQSQVVPLYHRDDLSMEDADRLTRTMDNLREITLDAIVTSFQHAANQVAANSLTLSTPEVTSAEQ